MEKGFEPKIVYFMCAWCGTGGSETAGAWKLKYPENVLPFRVNCTGSLETVHLLRALLEGADGVLISGCHPGDCHYVTGNYRARRRVAVVKAILEALGLDGDRVWLRWVAHGEGRRLADSAKEFCEHIRQKGPNPLKGRVET